MAPEERFVPRFAAEPPQEDLPYGRWQERLRESLLGAVAELDTDGVDLAPTSTGYELFGYVRFLSAAGAGEPGDLVAHVDYTEETAQRNPDWQLDLCDEVIGSWRGHAGAVAAMTLVWGHPLVPGGRVSTAELAALTVDQCELVNERFTLIAPDDYRHDLLEIALFDGRGRELARESLYSGDEQEGQEPEQAEEP